MADRQMAFIGRTQILSVQFAGYANIKTLAAAIKARWVCEQAHQQMKEELGLDHFEGRPWQGLRRHVLIMIDYAFLRTGPASNCPRYNYAGMYFLLILPKP